MISRSASYVHIVHHGALFDRCGVACRFRWRLGFASLPPAVLGVLSPSQAFSSLVLMYAYACCANAGAVGGAIWHGIKGARNAPAGHRIKDAFGAIRLRSGVLGGNFAVWGFMFSIYDCSFAYMRRKEDPWNAIMAGAATGGTLAARGACRWAVNHLAISSALLCTCCIRRCCDRLPSVLRCFPVVPRPQLGGSPSFVTLPSAACS